MMKGHAKGVVVWMSRLWPSAFWWRTLRLWMRVIARSEPKEALRTLLEIDDVLTKHIDRAAIRYGNGIHVKHRLMSYHDFFVDRLRAGEHVLDIGCGHGAVAHSMASRARAIVTGIDLDGKNIQMARRCYQESGLSFIHGDALKGLPPGPFETIVLSNILEHIEQRETFLRSLWDRFHPRRLLIRVPMTNRDWRVPMRRELGMFHFNDPGHYIEYTQDTFEEELRGAGLVVNHLQVNWGEIWAEAVMKSA